MDSLYLNTTFGDSFNSSLIEYGYILEKLHWYYLVTANRCLNTTSVAFLTQVYLSHRMHMTLRNVDSNPFMCYCFSNNQYAYDCGAYSLFFVPTRTLGINFINFSIVTTMLVGMTVFIVIPRIIIHCCCCMRSFQCKTNCRQIFQLRTFIILYLFCSFVSFLIECINWLPVESEILSYFIFYGRGVFRLLSGIFTVAAFILLMMLWANILRLSDLMQKKGIHHVKKNAAGEISSLNLCEISIIAIVHILFVLQFIISAICYSQFQRYFGIVYGVTTVLCLFYLTFITIGFVSYGVALYFKISKLASKSKRAPWISYKFTRFMILAELGFIAMYIILLLQVLAYFLGWDILGPLLGQYIINLIDFCLFYLQFCIMYSLINGKIIVQAYCCLCIQKKREKKPATGNQPNVTGTVPPQSEGVSPIPPLKKQLEMMVNHLEDVSSFALDLTPTNSVVSMDEMFSEVNPHVETTPREQQPSASTETVLSSHEQ